MAGNRGELAMYYRKAFGFFVGLFAAIPWSQAGILSSEPHQVATPSSYVTIVVKACPAIEQTGQDNKPEAVTGYYADPINHGVIYDNERSPTKEEREAYFATQHCVDVPIPPEVTTSGQVSTEMTMAQCMGHRGYLSAMQYLEMNPAYKSSFPAVGAWQCIEHPFPATGVAGM
jgi:hypothetical protein